MAVKKNRPVILIVDDEIENIKISEEIIRGFYDQQVQVKGEVDALKALHWIQENKVTILLVDLAMPEMNGADLIREVSKLPEEKRPKGIIMISGRLEENVPFQTDINLASIKKPVDYHLLGSYLARLIPPKLENFKLDNETKDMLKSEISESVVQLVKAFEGFSESTEDDHHLKEFDQLIFAINSIVSMVNLSDLGDYFQAHIQVYRAAIGKKSDKIRKKVARMMEGNIEFLGNLIENLDDTKKLAEQRLKMKNDMIAAKKFADEIPRMN